MNKMSVSDLIRKYCTDNPLITSNKELASKMIKENPDHFGETETSEINRKLQGQIAHAKKRKSKTIKVVDETKWSVSDNQYHWKASKGEIHLDIEFIDQLFFEYSEHGLNLSQTKIINKHDLKVWQWQSIKNTLQLYKQSHVFSPYTVEYTPVEEMQRMVAEKVGKVFSSIGFQVEDQYNKQLQQEYKKVLKVQSQKDLVHQTIIMELQDFIERLPELKILPGLRCVDYNEQRVLNVFIFDIHFGAEARTKDLPEYSPEKTIEMFEQIARVVNKLRATEVHLFFGGDNIETFTGLNHPDSWKGIAKGYYGAELIKRGYQALIKFIESVNNVKAIYSVPGNHDRATARRDIDGQGFIADILFQMIALSFKDKIEVKYHEKVITESVDGIHYIMQHGHLSMVNMEPAELILEYGDPNKFNVIVSGHLHNRKVKKDNKNFRSLVCPSIFPGNDYSVSLGVSSLPGFIIVENTGEAKPYVHDYSL